MISQKVKSLKIQPNSSQVNEACLLVASTRSYCTAAVETIGSPHQCKGSPFSASSRAPLRASRTFLRIGGVRWDGVR